MCAKFLAHLVTSLDQMSKLRSSLGLKLGLPFSHLGPPRRSYHLLKLDFAKAFDTIEHAPMLDIMKHMGFDDRWLGWMETIFGSGVLSVLLNGVPGQKFKCKCGVR